MWVEVRAPSALDGSVMRVEGRRTSFCNGFRVVGFGDSGWDLLEGALLQQVALDARERLVRVVSLSQTHTHTHTHTHRLSLLQPPPPTQALSYTHTHTHSHTLSLANTHTLPQALSYTHTHTHLLEGALLQQMALDARERLVRVVVRLFQGIVRVLIINPQPSTLSLPASQEDHMCHCQATPGTNQSNRWMFLHLFDLFVVMIQTSFF